MPFEIEIKYKYVTLNIIVLLSAKGVEIDSLYILLPFYSAAFIGVDNLNNETRNIRV